MQFRLLTKQDLAPLVAFNLAGIVTGALAGRLRDRERAARLANSSLARLLEASRALQAAFSRDDVEAAVTAARAAGEGTLLEDDTLAALEALRAIAIERAELAERVAEAAAAARSEELKTALLSSVSHDLRTPLAVIIASASSLSAYGDTLSVEARRDLLSTIVTEGERLNRFTGNLLELSRLQSGMPVPRQSIDPADVVASAAERLHSRLGKRLVGRVPVGAYVVEAEPALFEAAIANILDNAAIHAPASPVEISAQADGGWLEIAVSDYGPGIPESEREAVFKRFYRLDPSKPGSGIGLAIAKGFVEASDGSIEARSRVDGLQGARIVVRLPLAAWMAPSPAAEGNALSN